MQIQLFKWLKHLALIGVFLLFEPLIGVLYAKVLGVRGLPFWPLVGIVLAGYLGYTIQTLNLNSYPKWDKKKSLGITFIDILLGGLVVVAGVVIIYQKWIVLMLGMSVFALTAYVIGIRMVYRDYQGIYTPNLCRVLIGLGVVSVLLVDYPAHIIVVIYNMALYYIINNQGTIDQLLERSKKNVPVIAQIRSYNIKLISGIMVLFLIGYLVKNYLARFLNGVVFLLKQALIAFLNYLASLQGDNSVVQQSGGSPQTNAPFIPTEVVEGNKWLDIIAVIVGVLLILIVLRYAAKGLYKLYKQLSKWLKVWSNKVVAPKEKKSEDTYYYDQVEDLEQTKPQEKKLTSKKALKNWQKAVQQFNEQEDSVEKYRIGYQLVLEWFNLKGGRLPHSYTTWEICERRKEEYPTLPMTNETMGYNAIQYGELEVVPEEMKVLRQTLNEMQGERG